MNIYSATIRFTRTLRACRPMEWQVKNAGLSYSSSLWIGTYLLQVRHAHSRHVVTLHSSFLQQVHGHSLVTMLWIPIYQWSHHLIWYYRSIPLIGYLLPCTMSSRYDDQAATRSVQILTASIVLTLPCRCIRAAHNKREAALDLFFEERKHYQQMIGRPTNPFVQHFRPSSKSKETTAP